MPELQGLGHRVLGDLAPLAKIARMSTNPDPTQAVAIKAQARLEWNHPELHIGARGNSVAEAIDAIEELIIGLRGPKVVSINKVTITGGAGTPEQLASALDEMAHRGESLRAVTQNNAQLEAVLKDIYRVLHAIAADGPIGNLTPEFVIESVRKTLDTIRGQARAEGDARRKLVDEHTEHSTRIRKALGLAGSPGLASTWPDLLSYLETKLQQLKEAAGGKPTPTVAALAGDMSATLKENERLAGEVTRLSNRVAELEPWQEEARQAGRNVDYYRGLVLEAADELPSMHHQMNVTDAGEVVPDMLVAKLPEEVKALTHAFYLAAAELARRDGAVDEDALEDGASRHVAAVYAEGRKRGWISVGRPPPSRPALVKSEHQGVLGRPGTLDDAIPPPAPGEVHADRLVPEGDDFVCVECGVDLTNRGHKPDCQTGQRFAVVATPEQRAQAVERFEDKSLIAAEHIYLKVSAGRAAFEMLPFQSREQTGYAVRTEGVHVGTFDVYPPPTDGSTHRFDTSTSKLTFSTGVYDLLWARAAAHHVRRGPIDPPAEGAGDKDGLPDFQDRVKALRERYEAATPDPKESKTKARERSTVALGGTRGLRSKASQLRWLDRATGLVEQAERAKAHQASDGTGTANG